MKRLAPLMLLIFGFSLACAAPAQTEEQVQAARASKIVKYDNGIYYFEFKHDFGKELSRFMDEHPELELVNFAPYDQCRSYGGATCGYFVYFRGEESSEGSDIQSP